MRRGVRLKYIKRVRKPSGREYFYFKHRDGRLTPLPDAPENSAEFLDAYAKAAAADGVALPRKQLGERSLGRLAALYFASSTFKALAKNTQESRRRIIRHILDVEGKAGARAEDLPVTGLRAHHIEKDLAVLTLSVASARLKAWRGLMDFAKAKRWIVLDPSREVKCARPKSEPHRAWTRDDAEAFRNRWPLGTQQRLALELLWHHAPRRADLCRLGLQHIKGGMISWKQSKTGTWTAPRKLNPDAARAIKAFRITRPGLLTFMETRQGKARSAKSFGEWFRHACHAAGLKGLSAHGLRHSMGRDAAEAGLSSMAIGQGLLGHSSEREARTYTQAADTKRLADKASQRLEQERNSGNRARPKRETRS